MGAEETQSGGTALDTYVSFARWQQDEQVAGEAVIFFFYPLGSIQTAHLTDIPDAP